MTNVYNRKLSALTIKVTEALKYSTTLLPIDFLFEKFVPVQKPTTYAINSDGNTATPFSSSDHQSFHRGTLSLVIPKAMQKHLKELRWFGIIWTSAD